MSKTRKLAFMAVLTAVALTVFVIEAQLPTLVPIPGVKPGLANVITLAAMLLLGRKEAGAILLVRIIMSAMFVGSPATLMYSASGGTLAYIAMCVLTAVIPEKRLWVTSAIAALCHNFGQLMCCVLIVKTPGVFVYAPILAVSGIITGIFTGFAAMYLVRAVRKSGLL